eukprot:12407313-Karenia_brevis.AAC.1
MEASEKNSSLGTGVVTQSPLDERANKIHRSSTCWAHLDSLKTDTHFADKGRLSGFKCTTAGVRQS